MRSLPQRYASMAFLCMLSKDPEDCCTLRYTTVVVLLEPTPPLQYFDALTELDYQAQRDSWDGQLSYSMSSASQTCYGTEEVSAHSSKISCSGRNSRNQVENDKQFVHHEVESGHDGKSSVVWRRSWGGTWDETKSDASGDATSAPASLRAAEGSREVADMGARVGPTTGVIEENWTTVRGMPCVCSALRWCYKPVLRRLGSKSIEQVSRQLRVTLSMLMRRLMSISDKPASIRSCRTQGVLTSPSPNSERSCMYVVCNVCSLCPRTRSTRLP